MCGQWTAANSICAYMCTLMQWTGTQLGSLGSIDTCVPWQSTHSKAETELQPAGYRYCVLHAGKASLLLVEQTSG